MAEMALVLCMHPQDVPAGIFCSLGGEPAEDADGPPVVGQPPNHRVAPGRRVELGQELRAGRWARA